MPNTKNIQLKTIVVVVLIIIVSVVAVIAGYVIVSTPPSDVVPPMTTPVQTPVQLPTVPTPEPVSPTASLDYNDSEYGFIFTLPSSWKGYSIVTENWEGNLIDSKNEQTIKGPKVLIRHPLWTTTVPRQDIPIMVFTLAQWDLITKEKLSVGAAPIQPSELGHNARYVFALPARYNYAFPTGFEEVDTIMQGKPLQAY